MHLTACRKLLWLTGRQLRLAGVGWHLAKRRDVQECFGQFTLLLQNKRHFWCSQTSNPFHCFAYERIVVNVSEQN
jgi:hypothetical protein